MFSSCGGHGADGLPMSMSQKELKELMKKHPWALFAEKEKGESERDSAIQKAILNCIGKKFVKVDRREGWIRFVDL
jgi:hypothetical protein